MAINKGPTHMVEGGHELRKATNSHPLYLRACVTLVSSRNQSVILSAIECDVIIIM